MDRSFEEGHLWMGNLMSFMTEDYLKTLFAIMGFPLIDISIIKNRVTGDPLYSFLIFESSKIAQTVLYKYDDQQIPGVVPKTKFHLNVCGGRVVDRRPYFAIWMGRFKSDITKDDIVAAFVKEQLNLKRVHLVTDTCGLSKCFAFAEFDNLQDKQRAFSVMRGYIGLSPSNMPLKIRHTQGAFPQQSYKPTKILFVLRLQNVLGRTTVADLDEFFSKRFASYVNACLPRGKNKTPKEIAYIHFEDKNDVKAACEMLKDSPRYGNSRGLKVKILDKIPDSLEVNNLISKSKAKEIEAIMEIFERVPVVEDVEEKVKAEGNNTTDDNPQ